MGGRYFHPREISSTIMDYGYDAVFCPPLHVFTDASETAYGAVAFRVVESPDKVTPIICGRQKYSHR